MKQTKYAALFFLSLALTACVPAADKHIFTCVQENNPTLTFAFDTGSKSIWVGGLHFHQQPWLKKKEVSPDSVRVLYAHPLFLADPATGRSFKARIFYDYRFEPQSKKLTFSRYIQDAPAALAQPQEHALDYTCVKRDFFSSLWYALNQLD